MYTTLITGVSDTASETWQVVLLSIASLLVFFLAHVFSYTLSAHGRLPFAEAVAHGLRQSTGMLYAALPSTAVLVLGTTEGYDAEGVAGLAILVAMVVLFMLGYSAYARRGVHAPSGGSAA